MSYEDTFEASATTVEVDYTSTAGSSRLKLHHIRDVLQPRGIDAASAMKAGLVSYGTAEEAIRLLGHDAGGKVPLSPGIAIPYPGFPDYTKVRVDDAARVREVEVGRDVHGEVETGWEEYGPKCLCPKGKGNRVYFPFGPDDELLKTAPELWIAESEFKALALRSRGIAAIGIAGVDGLGDGSKNFQARSEGRESAALVKGFEHIDLKTKERVVLCFDSDVDQKEGPLAGLCRAASLLVKNDAKVAICYVPALPGLAVTGVDDFLGRHGDDGVQVLRDSVRPFNVSEVGEWLAEHWDDWTGRQQELELGRAARIAGVLYRHKKGDKKRWAAEVSKQLGISFDKIEALFPKLGDDKGESLDIDDDYFVEVGVPLLNAKFALYRYPEGQEVVFELNDRREARPQGVENGLRQVVHDGLKKVLGRIPWDGAIKRTIELWRLEGTKLTTEPEPFCFAGDDRICYRRFDWSPRIGQHPAWDEFTSRLTDPEAFMAFIWSCFEHQNRSRQYVWLHGDGEDGKSVVLSVLREVFGPAAVAISNIHMNRDNKFIYSLFYGKRLAVYPDCKNSKVGMSEILRNVTSGDPVSVEFKNKDPFTAALRIKLLIGANEKPEVTTGPADTSRLIYIEVAKSKNTDDPTWKERLEAELPEFLGTCRAVYERLCPHHGNIPINDRTRALVKKESAFFELRFSEFFETHLQPEKGQRAQAGEVRKLLLDAGITDREMPDFKKWLRLNHGIEFDHDRTGNFYRDCRLVSDADKTEQFFLAAQGPKASAAK